MKILLTVRGQHFLDQPVHGLGFDTHPVARPVLAHHGRAPVKALLVARRQRQRPPVGGHVEIVAVGALGILRRIHRRDRRRDPDPGQRRGVDVDHLPVLRRALIEHDLKGELIARFVLHHAVLHRPSGFGHQVQRTGDTGAIALGPVRGGQGVSLDRARRQVVIGAQVFGHAARRRGADLHPQNRVVEIGLDARLASAVQGLVDELEVEDLNHRLAHPPVLKLGAAGVHDIALNAGRALVRNLRQHHVARLHRREVVLRRPFLGVGFAVGVGFARLERLEHHVAVAVEFIPDRVEVHLTLHERHVLAPIIRVAFEVQIPPRFEIPDHIGRRSDRDHVDARRLKVMPFPLGFLQDGPQPHDERQFEIDRVEGEPDRARAGLLHLLDLAPCAEIARVPLGPEDFVRPHHILDRDRRTVRERRLFAQREFDPFAVRPGLDRLGQKAVKRERLVIGPAQQAFEDHVAQLPGRVALGDDRMEGIERPRFGKDDLAPLGRIRVGLRQVLEIRGKGRFPIHGDAVLGFGMYHLGHPANCACKSDPQHMLGESAMNCECHWKRSPVLRLFVASLVGVPWLFKLLAWTLKLLPLY